MDRHAQHHPRSRACVLPNGLRLHLAHDPAASRAAAWLRVAAGSHDEPSAHPGLAHFLEHLSFLGGAAFPGDERLMPWLQVRGGQVNASTRGRTTDYFFEVTAEHLGAGLARLIDMLARPLLDIDAQRREREVLEAEYLARSADEQTLIDAALALGLPAGHPLRRFAAGRRDSLALENDAFQRALREFHAAQSRRPSGLRKTTVQSNSLAHRTTWLRSDFVSLPGAATAWPWRTMRSSGPCANSMPP
ncbi:pyrroloquinoline quinone biosynthesis protein PqqF, partial [Pseudomonas aeruginosa]|uniref:pyrroloquinoline quinone biosynthesis protein PqqF n=1 Tax=Pseudomonas aeruginosa TaxID=287 RepID=UPI0023B04368